jgi:DNA protecting protein DprA
MGTAAALAAWLREQAPLVRVAVPGAASCDTAWREATELARTCRRRGWHVWTIGHAEYPERLGRLADPPAVLFVQGPATFPDARSIAIVGTREPSAWGEAMASACAAAAAAAGAVVVSGLAWGIDTAAHTAVVEARGRTWATLPAGLDIVVPSSNRALAARIVDCGGALVSEYEPGSRPHPTFFVERDRLQAALADVVLAIETGRTGGTHHTIGFARELGVPVWVTLPEAAKVPQVDPGSLPVPQQGTFELWRSGCPAVGPDDVARWVRERTGGDAPPRDRGRAQPAQRRLFDA